MPRLFVFALASIPLLAGEANASPLGLSGIATDLSFVETQAAKTLASLGAPSGSNYPSFGGDSGTWNTVSASSWTSGFFPGELWLLYQATGSPQWLADAQAWTAPLASQATRTDTHDVGFIIGESFGNGYRLTGNPGYATEILTAGASLATRYNPTVGAVRSWSWGPWQYPVIIDNMMTLGPLQWGAVNGGDSAWAGYAKTHAETTQADFVRTNGSTFQLVNFDPTTGAVLSQGTYAGHSNTSTWARGQAWALYGFVQAYEASGDKAFLTTAQRLANYFVKHLPADDVPYWDFNARVTPTTPRDSSAAAIAADGLIMLSTVENSQTRKTAYLSDAENILGSLSSAYLGPASGEAVLADGTGTDGNRVIPLAPSEVNTALIFGDYFFTEALLRLQDVLEGQQGWVLYSPIGAGARFGAFAAAPEPSTWAMMMLGFAGIGFAAHRRRGSRLTVDRPPP